MPLETTLSDIVTRLRQGKFPNEQAISQGVVLRVFQELGWDTWDTNLVWPEFKTGEGRADFALCHPPSKPAVFIEVKQLGKAEDAVRQALEYGFHVGVPFVVLTDGRTWSFYLPAEQGSYEDRRVYKLDLFERPTTEAAAKLHHYLQHDRVASGTALETARTEYPEADPYELLTEETVQPMAKDKPQTEQMKAAAENQFFHLTFGQYVGLNQRPAIKDLVSLIRNEATYEAFRDELLRQPVEHEDDASFLAGLKERMDAIEKMRNAVAHNRRPSKKTNEAYLNALPLVNQALEDYLSALAADWRDSASGEINS